MHPGRFATAKVDRMAVRKISDIAATLLSVWVTPALMAIERDQGLALYPTDAVLPRLVVA
jgi:hypothetical protein